MQNSTQTVSIVVTETDIEGVYSDRNDALKTALGIRAAYGADAQVIDWTVDEVGQFNLPTGEWL